MYVVSDLLSLVNIFRLFWLSILLWIGLRTTPAIAVEIDLIPSRIMVTTTDDKGSGSLRRAIALANQYADDNAIDLSQVSGTIALNSPSANCDRSPLIASLKSFSEFKNNFATHARNSSTNNVDVYGEILIH